MTGVTERRTPGSSLGNLTVFLVVNTATILLMLITNLAGATVQDGSALPCSDHNSSGKAVGPTLPASLVRVWQAHAVGVLCHRGLTLALAFPFHPMPKNST